MKKIILSLLLALPVLPALGQTCSNQVQNGDFEAGGNTPASFGFSSSYQYVAPTLNALYPEGRYTLVNNAAAVHDNFAGGGDHTTGTGRMMVINGSVNLNTVVWQETITVQPNTTYYFSTWVKNVVNGANAILQFSINGVQIGSNFSATGLSQWQRFFTSWNSGSNTTATIRLIDQQTAAGGNDFAIDDVFFTDVAPLTAGLTGNAASCSGAGDGSITVTASGGVGPFSYSLNGGPLTPASGNPFAISGLNPGNYSVVLQDACGNLSPAASATVGANDLTPPVVSGCPGDVTVYTGANATGCSAPASWTAPTAADNCSSVTISSTHNPNDVFPKGTTAVTYTFTDASNNSAICTFNVTVLDNTLPVITASNVTATNDAGQCGAVVTYPTPALSDNCPICSVTAIPGYTYLGTYNGHKYFQANGTSDWHSYQTFAQSMGGHLATIGSAAEEAFLLSNASNSLAWIGFNDEASEGNFVWVTGEPVDYANWCPGEPNNLGNENATTINWCGAGSWNDLNVAASLSAIIEFDCEAIRTGGPTSGSFFPVGTTTVTYSGTDASGNSTTASFDVVVTDNENPNAVCKPATVTLVNGSAVITAGDVDGGSTDNCAIATTSVSPTTFDCSNIGANSVTLTVTDIHGNNSTCTTSVTVVGATPHCAISVTPANNTYTGGVPTNIYLGYGPQSATIHTNATGGNSFTYAWSGPTAALNCTNCSDPVFTPTAPGTYTYTVLITNDYGCTTTCTVTFCVKDVKAPSNGNNQKIYVCHNGNTISISINGVPAHMAHPGDVLGYCGQTCGNAMARNAGTGNMNLLAETVQVYPNPNKGTFTVALPYLEEAATITVTDVAGKLIRSRIVRDGDGNTQSFDMADAARGMYFVQVAMGEMTFRTKVIIQ